MAMTRHGAVELAPSEAVMVLDDHKPIAQRAVAALAARAAAQPSVASDTEASDDLEESIKAQTQNVLDRWSTFVADAKAGGAQRCYSPYDIERPGNPVLQTALDELRLQQKGIYDDSHFVAPTSMRDVEPTVHLWLKPAGWLHGGRR